jgi:hypothetical protein
MSGMKDHVGPFRGGRDAWVRVTASRPCPVCRGIKACSVARDGGTVLCTSVESGPRYDRGIKPYWIHRTDGASATPRTEPVTVPTATRADLATRHRVYTDLLARCDLNARHRADLHRRGFDDATVRANGYGSLPERTLALVRTMREHHGEGLFAVPGFVQREGRYGPFGMVAAPAGLLVPCRDLRGRIVAVKVRRDEPGDGPRYLLLSSARHAGPSAVNPVHVSRFEGSSAESRVTEGELKADACTAMTGTRTVSVPGVSVWRSALPVLRALGATRVRVAFDMDHRTNPAVARALRDLLCALRAARFAVAVETWDPRHKGLDDYLAAQRRTEAA